MIKKLKINGLRGKSFELELEAVNLVIGANTAGKTTIADGIRWGLLGYIPGMAVPPRGWGDLLGDGQLEAAVELELAGGTVRRSMDASSGALKIKQASEADEPDLNVLSLDPDKFFAETGPRKAQMVAEASASNFDWKALVHELLRGDGFKGAASWSSWLGQAIELAKGRRGQAADSKKMLAQTLRGLESVRGVLLEDDSKLRAALAEAQQKLGVLKSQKKAVEQQVRNVQESRKSPNRQRLDQVLKALEGGIGQTHDAESYEKRLKDCKDRQAALEGVPGMAEMAEWREALLAASNDVAVQESRISQLQEGLKTVAQKYAKLKKHKACPTCGASGKTLAAALKRAEAREIDQHEVDLTSAKIALRQAKAEQARVVEATAKAEKLLEKKAAIDAELAALKDEGRLIQLWAEHDHLVDALSQEAELYDLQSLQERAYEIQCEIDDQTDEVAAIERALAEVTYKRSQKRQLADVEHQLERAEADWAEQNGRVHELEKLRERFTAMSLEPVLQRLGLFTKGIFAEPLSLDGTELGRMVGSRWVPLGQFSGAEQAVAVAALSCALSAGGGNIVLADELSAFDDAHLEPFLRNVGAAIKAGVISQFIGFSTPRKNLDKVPKAVKVAMI